MQDDPLKMLVGETLESITISFYRDVEMTFVCRGGNCYRAYHMHDCCETVRIHDIDGDLNALLGSPITDAREEVSDEWPSDVEREQYIESFTWTTHWIETETARVRIAWLGFSNGCCSEDVHFGRTRTPTMSIG